LRGGITLLGIEKQPIRRDPLFKENRYFRQSVNGKITFFKHRRKHVAQNPHNVRSCSGTRMVAPGEGAGYSLD
jgi:hypothetical protein